MSKFWEIPCLLHVLKSLLDTFFNTVATSFTDLEAISLIPLSHFTSNQVFESIIFFRSNAVIGPEPLVKSFAWNFFKAIASQLPFF